jgi:hypothetical protein
MVSRARAEWRASPWALLQPRNELPRPRRIEAFPSGVRVLSLRVHSEKQGGLKVVKHTRPLRELNTTSQVEEQRVSS